MAVNNPVSLLPPPVDLWEVVAGREGPEFNKILWVVAEPSPRLYDKYALVFRYLTEYRVFSLSFREPWFFGSNLVEFQPMLSEEFFTNPKAYQRSAVRAYQNAPIQVLGYATEEDRESLTWQLRWEIVAGWDEDARQKREAARQKQREAQQRRRAKQA